MNSLLERGLRSALSTLAEALDSESVRDMRPQQFDPAQRTPRSRRRTRQTEEQLEQDTTPEEERGRHADIEVTSIPVVPSARAVELRSQLRNRASVQRAFLLMELLDKPRALRPHRRS